MAPGLGQQRGLDAHKRVNSRKRQVLCDTGERIWRGVVHAANGPDSCGAQPLSPARQQLRPAWANQLHSVLTDKDYRVRFVQQVQTFGWQHQVASRPPTAARGFALGAQRCVVERTFTWLTCFRRVVTNHEHQPARQRSC